MAVVDSGSSFLLMPEDYFWNFYAEITKTENTICWIDFNNTIFCKFDKLSYNKLPELEFEIGGKQYRVPRKSLYVPLDDYKNLMAVEVTYIDGWD